VTDLVHEARRLLDEAPSGTVSAWPRAAAVLARMQLEQAIRTFWEDRVPAMVYVRSMRAQLSCLVGYVDDPRLVADIAFTWQALTQATHHHPYELDPTREELASLVSTTERVTDELEALAPYQSGPPAAATVSGDGAQPARW
jgi:hypothetical protein